MIKYCIDKTCCRKKALAQYFGDSDCDCNQMCDNCCSSSQCIEINASQYYQDMVKVLKHAEQRKERLTPLKLFNAWMSKGSTKLRIAGIEKPKHSKEICELIITNLLIQGYLKEEFHFTPYSTISYLTVGYRSSLPILLKIFSSNSNTNPNKQIQEKLANQKFNKKNHKKLKLEKKPILIDSDRNEPIVIDIEDDIDDDNNDEDDDDDY